MTTCKEITTTTNNLNTRRGRAKAQVSTLSGAMSTILQAVEENPSKEGLLQTPERFAKALLFFTKGYGEDLAQILRSALFHAHHRELVFVKSIEFPSLCERHLVPFIGKVGRPK